MIYLEIEILNLEFIKIKQHGNNNPYRNPNEI